MTSKKFDDFLVYTKSHIEHEIYKKFKQGARLTRWNYVFNLYDI